MKNLLYKELTLSINKFFYFLPLLLGLLFFIPQWFFTLVFMYLFWITVPQVYSGYLSNQDNNFTAALPITKKEIVLSKSLALVVLELIQLLIAVVFVLIHNQLYGVWNFGLDPNIAFFGVGFAIYGLFNLVFLPYYFSTGYRFGKPTILGTVVTLLFAAIIEYGIIQFEFMREVFEGNTTTQLIVLVSGVLLSVLFTYVGITLSRLKFETIDR